MPAKAWRLHTRLYHDAEKAELGHAESGEGAFDGDPRSAHERACQVLEQRREELERPAATLLERETLDQEELYSLLGQVPPEAPSLEEPATPAASSGASATLTP